LVICLQQFLTYLKQAADLHKVIDRLAESAPAHMLAVPEALPEVQQHRAGGRTQRPEGTPRANRTTPSSEPSPSNGCASFGAAGPTANPTTKTATYWPCKNAILPLLPLAAQST
jgi:hypothetical protein